MSTARSIGEILDDILNGKRPERVAGADLPTYLDQFGAAWWAVANASDPMPHNWRRHVAMCHANDVPLRELLGHVSTVCAPDFDARWCCVDCSFAHVIRLCRRGAGDGAQFGLEKSEGRA